MNELYGARGRLDGWSGSGSLTWDNVAQPQVLMAYKSPGLIFYSTKEQDCQVNTFVPRGRANTDIYVRV